MTERALSMKEIEKAHDEGRLLEAFGAGTGAIISPVKRIGYNGRNLDIKIETDPKNPGQEAGPLARRLFEEITDIQYGEKEHEWSVIVD